MAMLLDLYCGAGGAGRGYADAGFEVVGVDIRPQPHYPYEFHQADAIEFLMRYGRDFDLIHASPPCQAYTRLRGLVEARWGRREYPDLIAATREALTRIGRPYIIENVPGAPLVNPVMLCGAMFGLRVYRHRLFETSFPILVPPHPPHKGRTASHRGVSSFARGASYICVAGHNFCVADARDAMGIDWMSAREIAQAIPPAYTAFIGRSYMRWKTLTEL
jgi:DNA (cytosine-5)-methyltransferase 1